MLKERKLKQPEFYRPDRIVYGYCRFNGVYDDLYGPVAQENIIKEIDNEEYYFAEVKTSDLDTDYQSYSFTAYYSGVFLAFNLNPINTIKYFNEDLNDILFPKNELLKIVKNILNKHEMFKDKYNDNLSIEDNQYLKITIKNKKLTDDVLACCNEILTAIRDYYSDKDVHITRMFGSYVLLKRENGELKAIKATPIPIKYCPLMIKLLHEVGGKTADRLIDSLSNSTQEVQQDLMCDLINQVVIEGGYFDTNRPLNSCEANVLFGASETMFSAFTSNMIDAAVIVSNNLGTIITTNAPATQGAVKRMTGLFYTSPNEKLINTAIQEGIIPVFPITGQIDQLEGVKYAISLGYKNIAVSVAAGDNIIHNELSELEKQHGIKIYKFGLCSTGIDKQTAIAMQEHADVVWSCASSKVKEYIEPNAIAQVGIKIPVHIMTKQGWDIVKNHLWLMHNSYDDISLTTGDEKPVIVHSDSQMKVLKKKDMHKCDDCPYPCS